MARQWVVLFDTLGVDTLLPWDDLKGENMLAVLAGKKSKNLNKQVAIAVLRAQSNPQRFPEVWAYSTIEDYDVEEMRKLWRTIPQSLADLVRAKGTNLFRDQRQKEIII